MRVNMNKTKVTISGECQKVRQKLNHNQLTDRTIIYALHDS